MLDQKDEIFAAQIGFFAAFTLPAAYVLFRHGLDAIHGWFFVWAFTSVRIVGGALLLHADIAQKQSEVGSIMYNVALGPLIFAVSGVLHEASITVAHRSPRLLGSFGMWTIHIIVTAGLGLLIAGAVEIISTEQKGGDITTYIHLVQVGTGIYVALVIAMIGISIFSFMQPRHCASEKRLITAVVAVMPLLLLRILYSFLGSVINNSSWSFLSGGSLAEQVILDVIPEFLITMLLVGTGFITRNIVRDRKAGAAGPAKESHAAYIPIETQRGPSVQGSFAAQQAFAYPQGYSGAHGGSAV